jgi:hypothetical protein
MGEVIIPTILKPKEMKEETDECILPDNYWTLVVAPLVAGEQLKIDKQFQLWNDILLAAYNNLTEMYNFYCKPVEERKPKVKVRPMLLDVP